MSDVSSHADFKVGNPINPKIYLHVRLLMCFNSIINHKGKDLLSSHNVKGFLYKLVKI